MQGPSPEPVWYLLVDFKGKPFKRASAQNVSMPSFGSVADFQAAVKAKDAGRHLKGVDLLLVYKNKVAFDAGVEPLDPTSLMDNTDVENVLMVVVPPRKWSHTHLGLLVLNSRKQQLPRRKLLKS